MQVEKMMTRNVRTCLATDSTNHAAQIMWENDCGCVPVVDRDDRVIGIITDRDICMAAYTQGRPLAEISVGAVASSDVVTVRSGDTLHRAEVLMHDAQVRRLPVVDEQGRLVGLLSIGDLARRVRDLADGIPGYILGALAGVSQRRISPATGIATPQDGAPSSTKHELKKELDRGLTLLQTLRDEVRVRLHLGGLELRDQWRRLEPHLGEVEKRAEELTDASRAAVADAVKKLESLRSSLAERS